MVEKNYYTIDPMGKLTCAKCRIPLGEGESHVWLVWEMHFRWSFRYVPSAVSSMFRKSLPWERY